MTRKRSNSRLYIKDGCCFWGWKEKPMQKFLKLMSGGCDYSSCKNKFYCLGENDSNVYLFYDLSKQFPDDFMF